MSTNTGAPTAARTSADIDRVDVFSRQLYRRARQAGSDFSDVAIVVRGLHTVLKHLKVEAEDPGSLLNSEQSPVYVRQLTPIVEDSEFALKQLDTILERYGGNGSGSDGEGHSAAGNSSLGGREHDRIGLIRTKLANQKLNIDIFLDTVQLHNPSKSRKVVDTNNANLDSIKDKVDVIASRICQRKNSQSSEASDDNGLWLQFRDELEKEGFSRDVLRKNQDVLRAYIRQLDEQSMPGGAIPTVRGFLEGYQSPLGALHGAPDSMSPVPMENLSPKEMYPSATNEKFFPSMKMERLQPDKYPPYPSNLPTHATDLSYDRHSEEGDVDDGASDNSMALVISTRDLMALDRREADLAIAMGNMHLQPRGPPYATSNYTHAASPGSSPQTYNLPSSSNASLFPSSFNPSVGDQFGLSPRFVPPLAPPPYGGSPPPTLHPNSTSAPAIPGAPFVQQAQRYARLAPDQHGHDIPLDAQWTRIKRSLISPEVLDRARVRYEARPDFVAVLGVFTKAEIAGFARQSAEVRRRRMEARKREPRNEKDRYYPEKYKNWDVEAQQKQDSQLSSSSDLYDSSDSSESDEELPRYRPRRGNHAESDKDEKHDEEKGTKAYPFIVSPPEKERENGHSPAATVTPKPILKNKNDDPHVRFDPEPKVLDGSFPRSNPRHSDRDLHRPERRHRERSERGPERDRYVSGSYDDRDRDRDRDRGRDDEYPHRHHRRHHGGSTGGSRREKERDEYGRRRRRDDRDRYRDKDRIETSEDRAARKKARGETLRAVGIGGAAASLLSVLTEAAAGL
ncbi:uncharacterized protein BCR38DRAFT_410373 [Pseudomassariella vexata]|uniref:DUF8035 domain-containing protein n=1 Tax=Pseudomassariella vexata TaxID=1141098 RepID=A0A1Y2DW83_9PEZI|nr:uncharacterized protein BCR38DRAFT_410373 [Pseudomassariella vexata]ORY63449.1 hypothetical protein BCR38DRAFT_410373 [Pseudomassariella vexata]